MVRSQLCTYLLPFRRTIFRGGEVAELSRYFETLALAGCEVLVVDGSSPAIFAQHAQVFGRGCRHVRVDRRFGYLNDKVNGIHTGIELASLEKIVLADDDIRYTAGDLKEMALLLDANEMVRPQNFLRPLPWWGKMEAARMLINRALLRAADYPGTCAFRRQTMLAVGHYDGDVLFDNEEIIRHFVQQRCAISYANDFFVQKRPPAFRKWMEQRPRQAYEDFEMRLKTAFFFSLAPLAAFAGRCLSGRAIAVLASTISLAAMAVAWHGRRRGGARRFFPAQCCFFAPLWLLERALSTYGALYWYLRHGGYPFGDQLLSKGVGRAWHSAGRAALSRVGATPKLRPRQTHCVARR